MQDQVFNPALIGLLGIIVILGGIRAYRDQQVQTKGFGNLKGRNAQIAGIAAIISGAVLLGLAAAKAFELI